MKRISLACAAALLAADSAPALAQPPAAPAWQVDWGAQYCTLARRPDDGVPFTAGLYMVPGGESASLVLLSSDSPSAALPAGLTAVALAPSGRTFEVTVADERGNRMRRLVMGALPDEFWEVLAGSNAIELRAGDRTRLRIPLTGTRAAVAAFRRCASEAMREWGVDEAALRALRARPTSTNLFGLTANDYPPAALRTNTEGQVVVRIAVSSEGRATECTPVATSGSALLDSATCTVILERARFTIPLGADGRPTAARITSMIRWVIPQS